MTNHPNAQVAAQYVKDILEAARSALTVEYFQLDNPFERRWRMKQAAEKDTWTNYFDLEFRGEGTIKGVRDWLDMLEVISKELGSEPEIVTDYDSTLSAEWTWEVPFTAEEKQKAKEWLEANPAPEPTTIKWHKPVPFGEAEPF